MLKQYDGRSFAEVLETEVFATGSNPPDLMAAFGTLGVGTGGFGHLYDAAFLEVLRVLLWDVPEEFMLPEEDSYPQLFGHDEGGAWGFAMALAGAALNEARSFFPDLEFADMFKLDSTVVGSRARARNSWRGRRGRDPGDGDDRRTTSSSAMTSRAMQSLQLDLPYAEPAPDAAAPQVARTWCARAARRPSSGSTWSRGIG